MATPADNSPAQAVQSGDSNAPASSSIADSARPEAGNPAGHARGGRNAGRHTGQRRGKWDKFKKRKRNNNEGDAEDRPVKQPAVDKPKGQWEGRRKDRRAWGENPFTAEEIAAEGRQPKRKVAVMLGYSGTGYKGLQINKNERTIEGDVMKAFIEAGAISKANADDPQKVSLVRCARTDKGVHAAGNVLSLKMIIEDENIADKINANLPPQIRVWGIQRTNNNFSCYATVDSRWYEYLLPTYSLIPPHPDSFIGKKIAESAKEKGVVEEIAEKNKDCEDFWEKVDEEYIRPILAKLDPKTRAEVIAKTQMVSEAPGDVGILPKDSPEIQPLHFPDKDSDVSGAPLDVTANGRDEAEEAHETAATTEEREGEEGTTTTKTHAARSPTAVDFALRDIKRAYVVAKRKYRLSPGRLARLQEALDQFVGTNNFHNYTVQKAYRDSSAKRFVKSFVANPEPIIINNTEWLSLKVHGQSFMMHQIRKMVGLATLLVRAGGDPALIRQTYGPQRIAVPKAPALGLLLENPVFESYNQKAVALGKQPIDFDTYKDKIEPFKKEFIYTHIFADEEKEHFFHNFYQQVDNFPTGYFLWVTPAGLAAAQLRSVVQEDREFEKSLNKQLGQDDEERNQEDQEG